MLVAHLIPPPFEPGNIHKWLYIKSLTAAFQSLHSLRHAAHETMDAMRGSGEDSPWPTSGCDPAGVRTAPNLH
jgi:hypothetical protein